jgi:type 1 glutamine amidotransferase
MSKKALIVSGGWDGHHPVQVAEVYHRILTEDGFTVERSDNLDSFKDEAKVLTFDLVIPNWTMGKISNEQANGVMSAVRAGVGIAGCHGGMCDAFRENSEWQFMTGGQFVAHPGNDGTEYRVKIAPTRSVITEGISDFTVKSEQYYMHVDPAVKVLAYTPFPVADGPHVGNGQVEMPVIWTKVFGKGRVFYNSLGHHESLLASEPCQTILRRGFAWAAR